MISWRVFPIAALTLVNPMNAQTHHEEQPPLTARVTMEGGRPTLFVNEKAVAPFFYALTDVPGGRWSWEELPHHNLQAFAAHGFRLFQVDLFLEHLWTEDDRFDITTARKQIAGVQAISPSAAVMIRFHVTAPKWWMRRHPEEWVRYADADYQEDYPHGFPRIIEDDNNPVRRVSMASVLWKSQAASKLKEFLRRLAATPEGNALAGIQVADGVYGEWHNWGFFRNEPDGSVPMEKAFRAWLKEHYGTDARLQQAWHRGTITLGTAEVPGKERRQTTAGVFRDPLREQDVIDYYRCVHQVVADNILSFARIVKETWPRPIVTGTFYGYFFSLFGRQAAGGHLELQRVLSSPSIDYLAGPQAYEPEALKLGEPYRSRSLIASVRLHGKLWLDEMDCEPTVPIPRDANHDLLLRNSIANVRRNALFTATKGMGLWFYDFGVAGVDLDGFRYKHRGSRGTWDHPALLAEIQSIKQLVEARCRDEYRSEADVLFVYDTESFYHTASLRGADPVSNVLVDFVTLNAFKSGVVFDPIHIEDLSSIDLSPYRLIVFGNTSVLRAEQRAMIRDTVAQSGRTLVWLYAPGYTDGKRLDSEGISQCTGITVTPVALTKPPEIVLSYPPDSPFVYTGAESPVTPLFAVSDTGAEVLGRFLETSQGAIARKTFANHTAWYVSLPGKGLEPLRYILRSGGAHVYVSQGEIVYAGGGMLVVHTKDGGTHTVKLRSGREVSFDLPEGSSTLVLDAQTGELLMPLK